MNQQAPSPALPVSLAANPKLSSWLKFSNDGQVTVSPGKGALATYSPLLDPQGNSVRGSRAAAYLARRLGLDLLASQAVTA